MVPDRESLIKASYQADRLGTVKRREGRRWMGGYLEGWQEDYQSNKALRFMSRTIILDHSFLG